jgi:rSAM/selenodomain-associated transferase 1
METPDSATNCLLQLFARLPESGRVKTRLAEDLGEQKALDIYLHCLRHSLDLLRLNHCDHQLWLDRPGDHPLFDGFERHIQQGDDLGERMRHAINSGLRSHRRVLLIGADCLDMDPGCLDKAAARLDDHDLVLTPAEDGGFVLIGSRVRLPGDLFDTVAWGSEWVLRQTLEQALDCGLTVAVLHPLRDIDRSADLAHYPALADYC